MSDPFERWNLGITAGAVATSFAVASPVFAASLALGALIEATNFRALLKGSRLVILGDHTVGRLWLMGFGVRFAFLAVAIHLSIQAGAHPVGLVLGLSTVVPAVVVAAWRQRPAPDPNAPAVALAPDDPEWDEWNPWFARPEPERDEDEA